MFSTTIQIGIINSTKGVKSNQIYSLVVEIEEGWTIGIHDNRLIVEQLPIGKALNLDVQAQIPGSGEISTVKSKGRIIADFNHIGSAIISNIISRNSTEVISRSWMHTWTIDVPKIVRPG